MSIDIDDDLLVTYAILLVSMAIVFWLGKRAVRYLKAGAKRAMLSID